MLEKIVDPLDMTEDFPKFNTRDKLLYLMSETLMRYTTDEIQNDTSLSKTDKQGYMYTVPSVCYTWKGFRNNLKQIMDEIKKEQIFWQL